MFSPVQDLTDSICCVFNYLHMISVADAGSINTKTLRKMHIQKELCGASTRNYKRFHLCDAY